MAVKSQGGIIKDGRVIPPSEKLYVLESFFYAESQYESSGRYRITRQMRLLDKDLVEQLEVLSGKDDEELKEVFLELWEEGVNNDSLAYGGDVVEFGMGYIEDEAIKSITNDEEEYSEGKILLEVHLESKYGWRGYMSFFEIDKEDYDGFKPIDETFCKVLMWN